MDKFDYNYLTNIRPVGLTFAAIAMTLALACGLWTHSHIKDRVVVASQPPFLMLICIGCFTMASSIIPLSIDDSVASLDGCSIACMAFPWLFSIGFSTSYAALFSKIWRINKVFNAAHRMRRVTVKRTEPDEFGQSRGYCTGSKNGHTYTMFRVLIGIVNFGAVIFANIQAFRARNITTDYSESTYVLLTLGSLLQALIIGAPLLALVHENDVATYFLRSVFIFIITTSILGFMFLPKVLLIRRRETNTSASARWNGANGIGSRPPPIPIFEPQRLETLQSTGLLDSSPEERFDRITRLCSNIFNVPISMINLIDKDRQWFKSNVGLSGTTQTPRQYAFCAHTIMKDEIMIVPDALQDSRFVHNPLVQGHPDVRFYAGYPLKVGPEDMPIGTLCIIDSKPREVSEEDLRALRDFGELVQQEISVKPPPSRRRSIA
jgi:hypothetical protein